MFRVENNVPDVYINESRDFQLIARLYDLAIQSSRFSIDSLKNVSDTHYCNEQLLPLLATKVGLFDNISATDTQYRHILAAFPYIIRYKGCYEGIRLILNLFARMHNTSLSLDTSMIHEEGVVTILLDKVVPNLNVMNTLLNYIRPVGTIITYAIKTEISSSDSYKYIDHDVKVVVPPSDSNEVSVVIRSEDADYTRLNNIGTSILHSPEES